MVASMGMFTMPPDTRTDAQKQRELNKWEREAAEHRKREREAVLKEAQSLMALEGVTIASVHLVQGIEGDWDNDCRAILTLADGRKLELSQVSLDYDGEDATPVILTAI